MGLRGDKARENAALSLSLRDSIAAAGPHLADDNETIVIPSPSVHPAFTKVLRRNGFHFEYGACPWWERPVRRPVKGKTYSAAKWLEWADARYKWAWPGWKRGG